MSLKTTLCATLLSLSSVSMIACNNSKNSNGSATYIATIDTSIESQLKVADAEVKEIETTISHLKANRNDSIMKITGEEVQANLVLATEKFEAVISEVHEAANSGTIIDQILSEKLIATKAQLDEAKKAVANFKAESDELNKEIQILEIELTDEKRVRDILLSKDRIKTNRESLKTADAPHSKKLAGDIRREEILIKKIQLEIDMQKETERLVGEI